MKVAMLLLASGRGERLGADVPKAFFEVAGETLVVRSLKRLARVTDDREIVLAVQGCDRAEFVDPILPALHDAGMDVLVDGGATRQASMQLAFAASAPDADVVLVHDAARPFFPIDAVRTAITRAHDVGGALLATRVADTLKRVDRDHRVRATIDRTAMWAAQTPQLARREALEAAIDQARRDGFTATDDVSLLEHIDIPVEVVDGCPRNIKITTPADLELAEWLARGEP